MRFTDRPIAVGQPILVVGDATLHDRLARRLGISVHTAKFHVGSIIDKLDSSGRTDAVAYALRVGVLRL